MHNKHQMKKAIENIFTFVSIREIPPHTSLFYPPGTSLCLHISWQLAAHADEIESKRRVSLSSFGLFRKRCSRLFSNYKSKTLMRASPLPSPLYVPLPVWHHSICQPWLKWRNFPQFQIQLELEDADEWGKTRRRGGDVPKVLSMQMTGQTTCRYNGNNNSNNNNNNSNVVIFTGTHTHSHTHLDIEHLSM